MPAPAKEAPNATSRLRRPRALVLCPGPGLAAALPLLAAGDLGAFEVSLAVNRAAKAWPGEYWCCLDAASFSDVAPAGAPVPVTTRRAWRKLLLRRPEWETRSVLLREDLASPPPATRWSRYSATTAAVAAWNLEAATILVVGADLVGKADWDGASLPRHRRDERRWRREAQAWSLLAAWLRGVDAELIRWRPPGDGAKSGT